jgi:hypothetical protein
MREKISRNKNFYRKREAKKSPMITRHRRKNNISTELYRGMSREKEYWSKMPYDWARFEKCIWIGAYVGRSGLTVTL